MTISERDGHRDARAFIFEVALIVKTHLAVHVVDRDDKAADEIGAEDALNRAVLARVILAKSTADGSVRKRKNDSKRTGETHIPAFDEGRAGQLTCTFGNLLPAPAECYMAASKWS